MADQRYQTQSFRFSNKGLIAKYVNDTMPPGTYLNLENLESLAENSITTRLGITPLTVSAFFPKVSEPLAGPPISLGRMRGLTSSYRYASAGGYLYRSTGDQPQAWTKVTATAVLSGQRMSFAAYRPNGNASPYMFMADSATLLKDNGTISQQWGINPPYIPPSIQIGNPGEIIIEDFDEADLSSFAFSNVIASAQVKQVGAVLAAAVVASPQVGQSRLQQSHISQFVRAASVVTATCDSTNGMVVGMLVATSGATDSSFNLSSVTVTAVTATTFSFAQYGPNATITGQTAIGDPTPSLNSGMLLKISDGANTETVLILNLLVVGNYTFFTASFKYAHAIGIPVTNQSANFTVAAANIGSVSKTAVVDLSSLTTPGVNNQTVDPDYDFIQLVINCSEPGSISEIRVMFDVSDGNFDQSFYYKAINPATWQPAVTNAQTNAAMMSARIAARAAALTNQQTLGYVVDDLVPADSPILTQLQPPELGTGVNSWTVIQIPKSQFVPVGSAGSVVNDWSKVVAWRVQVTSAVTFQSEISITSLMLIGGSDLNSYNGQPYDYRYTYYNINTAAESNPSQTLQPQYFVTPQRQAVQIDWTASPDPQVTHVNLYRRGGELVDGWYLVQQVPIGTTVFIDTIADTVIEDNPDLQLTNDPPITSVLPVPVNTTISEFPGGETTFPGGGPVAVSLISVAGVVVGQLLTIGTGANQENAYVLGGDPATTGQAQLWLQNAHSIGEVVSAQNQPLIALPLLALAFDQMWMAGDPNNPHVLYYSLPFTPESFPVTNTIEIGTPDAPIRCLIAKQGVLFVGTSKTWYQILGAGGTGIPTVIPTGIKHGVVGNFAWALTETYLFYVSYDGLYITDISTSQYFTRDQEWIWTNQPFGPVPPIPSANLADMFLTFSGRNVYASYTDASGKAHRLIFDMAFTRWRNDDQGVSDITAMNGEDDTGALVIGKQNGMVYLDRSGTQDIDGYALGVPNIVAINFNLQTTQLDFGDGKAKASKVFNELTLDWCTNGQPVDVTLLFDDGETILDLGTFQTGNVREQTQININAGAGQRSLNVGIMLSGSVTMPVVFYECHIRAVIEAEYRKSWDTYELVFGTPEFKLIKQGWFVYSAPDPAGITVNAYTESSTVPAFSFNLESSATRRSARVRFPATKFKIARFTGTSPSDFQMYADSELEVKPLCSGKGYGRQPFVPGVA